MASVEANIKRAAELIDVSDSCRLDVELLLAHVLKKTRTFLYTWPETQLSNQQQQIFDQLFLRRKKGEPVAHILGRREFWGLDLHVNNSTLIPRPDTELLIEVILERFANTPLTVADVGTGTGAIALALAHERPQWSVLAADNFIEAVELAELNRRCLSLDNVQVSKSDWLEKLPSQLDLIVSNPPYIAADDPHLQQGDVRFEPRTALVAAEEGLRDIKTITAQAKAKIKSGGWIVLEHGYQQGEQVRLLLKSQAYTSIETYRDLGGNERLTLACWSEST